MFPTEGFALGRKGRGGGRGVLGASGRSLQRQLDNHKSLTGRVLWALGCAFESQIRCGWLVLSRKSRVLCPAESHIRRVPVYHQVWAALTE